jgi:sigma-E factor negative regulatory protein RseA
MTTKKEELLSIVVDEETSEFEAKRLCKALLEDQDELARWSRYHLIRDALRGNLPAVIDVDFGSKVMAKINDESIQPKLNDRHWRRTLLGPVAGFSLAASVAVLTVLAFQWYTAPAPLGGNVSQLSSVSVPKRSPTGQVGTEAANADAPSAPHPLAQNPELAARLNSYLVNHSEYAPSRGVMPYARVVAGYEDNR